MLPVILFTLLLPIISSSDAAPSAPSCRPRLTTSDAECLVIKEDRSATSNNSNYVYVYVPWFSDWGWDVEKLNRITTNVMDGSIVSIRDALHPQIANHLHHELQHYDHWNVERSEEPTLIQFQRRTVRENVPPLLLHLHRYLSNTNQLKFFQQFPKTELSSWSCMGKQNADDGPFATEYASGDWLSPHTDFKQDRALSLILSMTKNWSTQRGGALWWFNGRSHEFVPEFNTLYLFVPSPRTFHMVTPVVEDLSSRRNQAVSLAVEGGGEMDVAAEDDDMRDDSAPRRYAISGWFESVDGMHSSQLEHRFPLEESRAVHIT